LFIGSLLSFELLWNWKCSDTGFPPRRVSFEKSLATLSPCHGDGSARAMVGRATSVEIPVRHQPRDHLEDLAAVAAMTAPNQKSRRQTIAANVRFVRHQLIALTFPHQDEADIRGLLEMNSAGGLFDGHGLGLLGG